MAASVGMSGCVRIRGDGGVRDSESALIHCIRALPKISSDYVSVFLPPAFLK